MKRFLPVLLVSLFAAVVFAIRTVDDTSQARQSAEEAQATQLGETVRDPQLRQIAPGEDGRSSPDESSSKPELPIEFVGKSSWTAPYEPSVWDVSGWRFDEDAMHAELEAGSTAETTCTAEFLRDWLTLTASLHVSAAASTDRVGEPARRLILEVVDRTASTSLRVTLQPGQATVESIEDGHATLLREAAITEAFDSSHVRLLLTPNRLLVRGNDRLLLNAPRPASLTGRRCRFRMTASPGTTIRELRFDGE